MKKAMMILAMLILSAFVTANSVYETDESGFHIYEDFYLDYNASMWSEFEHTSYNYFKVIPTAGILQYRNTRNTGQNDAFYLNAVDGFKPTFQDEWDITVRARGFQIGQSTWADVTPFFQTEYGEVITRGGSDYWIYNFWSNYGTSGSGSVLQALYVNLNGQQIEDLWNVPVGIKSTWQDFTFKKRNLPDGTFYIEFYVDNVLYKNQSSRLRGDWSLPSINCGTDPTCIVEVTDFPTDPVWLGFQGYGGSSNHNKEFDSIDIRVYNYNYQACTPAWSCSQWAECTNPAPNVSCVAVNDSNNCGEEYSGDFTEFGVQQCIYPCFPNWECTGHTETCTNDTQPCDEVVDTENCGEAYTGDFTEFEALSCCNVTEKSWTQCDRTTLMQEKCVGFDTYAFRMCGYNPYTYGSSSDITNVPDPEAVVGFTIESPDAMIQWVNAVNTTGIDYTTHTGLAADLLFVDHIWMGEDYNSTAWVQINRVTGGCDRFKLWYAPRYFSDKNGLIEKVEQAERLGQLEFNYYDNFTQEFYTVKKQAEKGNLNGDCRDPTVCKYVTCTNGNLKFQAQHFSMFLSFPEHYTEADIGTATVSTIAKFLISFGAMITIVVVAVLGTWGYRKFKK